LRRGMANPGGAQWLASAARHVRGSGMCVCVGAIDERELTHLFWQGRPRLAARRAQEEGASLGAARVRTSAWARLRWSLVPTPQMVRVRWLGGVARRRVESRRSRAKEDSCLQQRTGDQPLLMSGRRLLPCMHAQSCTTRCIQRATANLQRRESRGLPPASEVCPKAGRA